MNFKLCPMLAVSATLAGAAILPSAAADAKPNIVLVMTDDQGWGDSGYNGHPDLKTPHLDALSQQGVTFNRFYSAAAMCSPTRGSCYTGRNPYRFGITFAMQGMLEDSEIPITTVLKENGYTTGHFGKWHMGTLTKNKGDQSRWGQYARNPAKYFCPPWERDVDVSFVTESKVPTWDPTLHPGPIRKNKKAKAASNMKGKPYGNDFFTGPGQIETENLSGCASRVVMDRAVPFIQDAVAKEQPFLAVVWFHAPHSPIVGGPEYRKMYPELSEDEQHYYASITAMDEQVGRLRAELKSLGVEDNTMLWFCSDNGPARQGSPRELGRTAGLSGVKLSINEGGIRVPGLMVWPAGVKGGQVIDVPCVTSDYFPTILDAIGVDLPVDRTYDGISLLPLLQGKSQARSKPIGFLNRDGKETVWMDDQYKLIDRQGEFFLYDIPADPAEKNNLADDLPEVTTQMKKGLVAWRSEVLAELKHVRGE